MYETADGEKFALLPGSPKKARRMALDTSQPPRLYVTAWRVPHGGLWRFSEGKWERLRDDKFIYDVAIDPTDPRRIAVATHDHPYHDVCSATGVWVSADGGTTWSQQNDGLPELRGTTVRFNPHDPEELVFGSHGRGFFITRWPKR
ncbi:MAG: hypothetical protein NT049_10950 [Planctomycetota bacterium]|nr:hypothetical protein [Planctomycetota bacterium]